MELVFYFLVLFLSFLDQHHHLTSSSRHHSSDLLFFTGVFSVEEKLLPKLCVVDLVHAECGVGGPVTELQSPVPTLTLLTLSVATT